MVGSLVTRIGTRKTLLCGCAVLTAGTLLMAFAVTTAWHYALYFGVIIGIGVGLGSVIPIQSSLTFWFKRRRAAAMAIVMSASGVSALISAPLLAIIIDRTGNWRMGWVAVMITAIIAAIIVAFGAVDKPENIDQHPDGVDPLTPKTESNASTYKTRVYQSPDSWSMAETIKTRSWWLLVLGAFAFFAAFYFAMGHGVVHLLDLVHGKELASFSVGLVVVCSIAGRLLAGWLGDRIEPRYTWSFALGMMFMGIFLLKNGSSVPMVYAYAATLGIGMGASYVCMITLIGNYFGADAYAQIAGLLFPIATVLGAFSPILAGIAYDNLGSYKIAFYGAMLITFLGAFSMLFATPPRKISKL
jgi:MFS family permease